MWNDTNWNLCSMGVNYVLARVLYGAWIVTCFEIPTVVLDISCIYQWIFVSADMQEFYSAITCEMTQIGSAMFALLWCIIRIWGFSLNGPVPFVLILTIFIQDDCWLQCICWLPKISLLFNIGYVKSNYDCPSMIGELSKKKQVKNYWNQKTINFAIWQEILLVSIGVHCCKQYLW